MPGDVVPAAAFVSVVVEIRARRTHGTKGKRHAGLQWLRQPLGVAERHRAADLDVHLAEIATGSFRALAKEVEMRFAVFRRERRAQPAIRRETGVLERFGPERCEIDGNAVIARLRQAQRFAFATRQWQLVVLAIVGDALAREGEFHDVHGLAHARQRRLERAALQPFHHLWSARAQAKQEAVARNRRHG